MQMARSHNVTHPLLELGSHGFSWTTNSLPSLPKMPAKTRVPNQPNLCQCSQIIILYYLSSKSFFFLFTKFLCPIMESSSGYHPGITRLSLFEPLWSEWVSDTLSQHLITGSHSHLCEHGMMMMMMMMMTLHVCKIWGYPFGSKTTPVWGYRGGGTDY
jgi:hypothetical protein